MKRWLESARDGAKVALFAVLAVWLTFDVLVVLYGESPSALLPLLVRGTWGTSYGIGQVLYKATPLLFSGLGISIALRAGLFNIGAEGQMAVASLATAVVGAHMGGWPSFLAVTASLATAALAGAAWALPAAALRARLGVHEVISTILLNCIAAPAIVFLLSAGLALRASVRTADIAATAHLSRLDRFVPAFHGSAVSAALPIALLLTIVVAIAFARTRAGREFELIAQGPRACEAERIPVARRRFQALLLSGAVVGLVASATVLGFKGAYEQGLGAGAGFAGIAVALMGRGARGSVVGLVLASLFFGTLSQGGLVLNVRVPMELMDVLQAIVIVAVAIADRNVKGAWARKRSAVSTMEVQP